MSTKTRAVTMRMNTALYNRVMAQRSDDESQTALYNRVLTAGLDVLEGDSEHGISADKTIELEALRLSVQVLTDQLERQSEQLTRQSQQLTAALDQNAELTEALRSEQETAKASLTLQGMAQQKQLEETTEPPKKRGRIRRWFRGE